MTFSHKGYETKTGVSIMRCKNDQPKAKRMRTVEAYCKHKQKCCPENLSGATRQADGNGKVNRRTNRGSLHSECATSADTVPIGYASTTTKIPTMSIRIAKRLRCGGAGPVQ